MPTGDRPDARLALTWPGCDFEFGFSNGRIWVMGFFRVLGLFVVVAACGVVTLAQRGLTDGVYSDSQATRGGRVYRQACASCHARNLEGGEMGPGLTGGPFITAWEGESLAALMAYVQELSLIHI